MPAPDHPPLPRTYLFVPGDRPERFAKALASGADAVVLDLEDAVQPQAKAAARQAVAQWLAQAAPTDLARTVLRINDAASPWHAEDVTLLANSPAATAMLPKAESAQVFHTLAAQARATAWLALIETARGVQAAAEVATAPGVQRLVFGTLDYALDMDLSGEDIGLEVPASLIAIASRAAGLAAPVAGVTVALDDCARLLADWARARAHGFGAKLCIHPRQVAPLHTAMQPSATELEWARQVLEAAQGTLGAVQLNGRMIDKPVIERARRLLARAQP
jgi:citrate lyase subunit beta / citryl-CoA lyase